MILSPQQIEHFVTEGFIRIDNAFSKDIAAQVVDILWDDIPFERTNPASWKAPVVRLGMHSQKPFIDSVNTAKLHAAFDQLVGPNKWIPCQEVGTFPIRFPSADQPGDTGKHVDASFPGSEPTNYFEWRINIKSKGRGLLMLVLYSDVGEADAPTVIYPRSHSDIARLLKPHGDCGLSFMQIANRLEELPMRAKVLATGSAGTVYLCHPFLVHAAQAHQGTTPKFMAQPPLLLQGELTIDGSDDDLTPVEKAIKIAIASDGFRTSLGLTI